MSPPRTALATSLGITRISALRNVMLDHFDADDCCVLSQEPAQPPADLRMCIGLVVPVEIFVSYCPMIAAVSLFYVSQHSGVRYQLGSHQRISSTCSFGVFIVVPVDIFFAVVRRSFFPVR